jgi:pimeloyl-ACP methyl ester carboxylesterase
MRKLFAFMVTTLDGYYEGQNQEFDWPNVDDAFLDFSVNQLREVGVLLFGRVTYEGMAAYWPSDDARKNAPEVADLMNSIPKLVFSTTLTEARWQNTTLVTDDPPLTVEDLGAISCRTLVMIGDDDEVTLDHALEFYRSVPDAELAVVPGTSHGLLVEKPDLCNRILLGFLTGDPVPTIAPIRRAAT